MRDFTFVGLWLSRREMEFGITVLSTSAASKMIASRKIQPFSVASLIYKIISATLREITSRIRSIRDRGTASPIL